MYSLAISKLADGQPTAVSPDLYSGPGGRLVHGLHKLVSQAVFLLMSRRGSVAGEPSLGISLHDQLARILLSETAALQQILAEARSELIRALQQIETELTPVDERIEELTLEAIDVLADDQLLVQLSLTSQSGESATYNTTLFTTEMTG